MALRLDLANKEDRKFLESKGVDTKALWDEAKAKATLTLKEYDKNASNPPEIAKKAKYGNRRVMHEDMWFDSQHELNCWLELKQLEKEGKIKGLDRQITLKFEINEVLIMRARPDFSFSLSTGSNFIPLFADAKSAATENLRPFKIAQKLSLALYGTPIIVFTKPALIRPILEEYSELNK